jgi:hypothetical protein
MRCTERDRPPNKEMQQTRSALTAIAAALAADLWCSADRRITRGCGRRPIDTALLTVLAVSFAASATPAGDEVTPNDP